jgi:hypothetical protein
VTGVQRLFSSLTVELLRCEDADAVPPAVHSVDLQLIEGGVVQATIDASDGSGIARIIALKFSAGGITPTVLDLAAPPVSPSPTSTPTRTNTPTATNTPLPGSPTPTATTTFVIPSGIPLPDTGGGEGPFVFEIPDMGPGDALKFLVQDGACNVTWATGKGAYLRSMIIDAGAEQRYVPDEPAQLTTKVFSIGTLTQPLYYEWDFGDGTLGSGTLSPEDLVPDGLGNVDFAVEHTYGGLVSPNARVTVLDAAGGIAVDSVQVVCDETSDADEDALDVCSEVAGGTDPADPDSDDDTLPDGDEVNEHGSDPLSFDTDGDTMPDPYEVAHPCLDVATADGGIDDDIDAVTNAGEQAQLTDPCDADTDDDGYKDKPAEAHDTVNTNVAQDNCVIDANAPQLNTDGNTRSNGPMIAGDDVTSAKSDALGDPCDADDDNDGLLDAGEPTGARCDGKDSDPLMADTDGDHLIDKWECERGTDPGDASSAEPAGVGGGDADGDGVPDIWERRGYDTSTASADSDGDGCGDLVEIASVDLDRRVGDPDRLAVARRALLILPADAQQDYVLDISKNGAVDDADRLLVARVSLGLAPQPNSCPK